MSTNKYKPHIHVIPEDDANRQIANGFLLNPDLDERVIQVLPIVGGWSRVVDVFESDHALEMRKYSERRIVLIIDFDNQADRLNFVKNRIPPELSDRVFVLGVLSNPEELKANLNRKGLEDIGISLSKDCSDNTREVWGHNLLKHNLTELNRMVLSVKPFLFTRT